MTLVLVLATQQYRNFAKLLPFAFNFFFIGRRTKNYLFLSAQVGVLNAFSLNNFYQHHVPLGAIRKRGSIPNINMDRFTVRGAMGATTHTPQ